MKRLLSLRLLLIAIMTSFSLSMFVSCTNDDEPDSSIGYYLSIRTRMKIFRRGGLPPDPKEDLIGKITIKMKESIKECYPVPDDFGDDAAVMVACDEVYRYYLDSGFKSRIECVATLYRARMSGTIIKQSYPLKNYYF